MQNANGNPVTPTLEVRRQPGCLLQLLYFVFIGWWLGALAVSVAYFCFAFILTIPFGVMIINRIPTLMALRQPPVLMTPWGEVKARQHNIILRAIWFFVVGLWLTAAWMTVAYILCVTIVGMPLGFWMFDRAPALLTLHRN
jgi:uncharacterized membrane protein YccF (DUF307 family)